MTQDRVKLIDAGLRAALKIEQLEVIDESHLHQGHAGAATGLGHFRVKIQSAELASLALVKAHQRVYQALGNLMKTDIHALSIQIIPAPHPSADADKL